MTSWPSGWCPTPSTWASPISSCCRSTSTRSTAPGATSRSACSRRPAATARPRDFARFVDRCHAAGLGVLLDWVPGHFPTDAHGLGRFDGTALYEHEDPRQGFHQDWSTLIYNFGRTEVVNFLHANALFWLDRYHVDGLRVDAVASMLYLDYSRKADEWVPNKFGGRENLEAVDFMRRMNELAYGEHPGVMTVAEESTAWPGVSRPTWAGGLGLRLQMEHGVDARHPGIYGQGSGPSPLASPPDDLRPALRLLRELRPAAQPRRGGARQGLDPGRGCRATPGRSSPTCAPITASCGAIPARSSCSWARSSRQGAEWNYQQSLDWHLLEIGWHKGVQLLVKDLNRALPRAAGPASARLRRQRLRLGRRQRRRAVGVRLAAPRRARHALGAGGQSISRRCRARATASACRRPAAGAERLNTDAALYGGSGMGNLGGVEAVAEPWHGQPCSAVADPAAAWRRCSSSARAEPRSRSSGRKQDVHDHPPPRRPVAQRHGLRAGRRPRLAAVRADRPARQARGLFRRQGPDHRLRAVQRDELRHPPDRRRDPVQGAQPDPPPAARLELLAARSATRASTSCRRASGSRRTSGTRAPPTRSIRTSTSSSPTGPNTWSSWPATMSTRWTTA